MIKTIKQSTPFPRMHLVELRINDELRFSFRKFRKNWLYLKFNQVLDGVYAEKHPFKSIL